MDDSQKVDIETQIFDEILLQLFEDKWALMQDLNEITMDFPTEKSQKMLQRYKSILRINSANELRRHIIGLVESRNCCLAAEVLDDIFEDVYWGLDCEWD